MSNTAPPLIKMPSPADWVRLVLELRSIAEAGRKGGSGFTPLRASDRALAVMLQFLLHQPAFIENYGKDLEPLIRVRAALLDIQLGRQPPLLKAATNKRKGPRTGSMYEAAKGEAARALSLLLKSGLDEDPAAQRVVAAIPGARRAGFTAATVKNWRKRLEQGPGPGASPMALHAYHRVLPADFGLTAEEQAGALLRNLSLLAFPSD